MKFLNWFMMASLLLFSFACDEDSPMETPDGPPTITFSGNFAAGSTACAGQELDLAIEYTAEAGINDLIVYRNGTQVVTEREDLLFNTFTYNLKYLFSNEDLANGSVTFSTEVTDIDNRRVTGEITFNVVAEYAYDNPDFFPRPAYDLIENDTVGNLAAPNADIKLKFETESCGSFCTNSRITFSSQNGTRFYNITGNPDINYVKTEYKQADVMAAIAGMSGDTSIVVFSNFPEDLTANGFVNNNSLVIDIRGTGEYAVFGANTADLSNLQFSYKKRTEDSGK